MAEPGAGPRLLQVRATVPGRATGTVLHLGEPLSLWGGLDPETGAVIDRFHPRRGEVVSGRVVVLPGGRGSSSASSVLAEAIRLGTAPAAFVLTRPDEIIALGALVGSELYGTVTPVVVAAPDVAARLQDGQEVTVDGATLRIE